MSKIDDVNKSAHGGKTISRREFLRTIGAAGAAVAGASILNACSSPPPTTAAPATAASAAAAPATAGSQPFKGTKIRMILEDAASGDYITNHLDEFTALTGIEVTHDNVAWGNLLTQSQVELQSASGTYDVMTMIYINAVRWMRAGWCTPLDDYVAKSSFDIGDFLSATTNAMSWQGKLYGIPYTAESTQMIYRDDILTAKGVAVPQTFDDLGKVLAAIANPPEFYAYVMRTKDDGVHFPFPIWLQGFGGNIFRDPPNDVTPTLNTPEALQAADNFTSLIMKYSIAGAQIYDTPDCQTAMEQGKAGIWIDALGIFPPIMDPASSTVADKVQLALVPGGPAGQFPQIASHGWMIPTAAKNKDAAWELIKWMSSKAMTVREVTENNFAAIARASVLSSSDYAKRFNTAKSNIGELIVDAINKSKCAYRQIPEFPEVGKRMGDALDQIISGQMSVKDAMDSAQKDAEQIMIAGGNTIKP
jgi:multiple sugar transport system substrate-binding protein